MPLTGIDDAWQTRIPQGWQQFADGSIGPPNQIGSDWNAPYRGAPAGGAGISDWLKQLIPSPGAATPNAPGGPGGGVGPGGAYMPGGGVMGRQAVTPGAPSMGFPAQGGPQVFPPQNSTIPPMKSVGPFTGGASTEGSYYDPRNWFKANPGATFQQGQPMGPDVTGGGGFNPLSALGATNPYARAAIAGAGVMQPTPTAANDQAPTNAWFQRPSGVGGMPGPQVTNNPPGMPARPYSPTPQNYPSWPTPGPGSTSPAVAMANAPPGNPSDTPRPGGIGSDYVASRTPRSPTGAAARAPAAAPASNANNRFTTVQYQVPGSGYGPLSRSPIYTALNLFGGRS